MRIRFSRLSVFKLEKLLEYLESEWSEKSKIKFLKKLNSKIESIERNPYLYPSSIYDTLLKKCVITKHTSILYEVQQDSVFILNLIDNRQDQENIRKEMRENFGTEE